MSAPLPPYLRVVPAPNPGPMTLEGTNAWLVGDPDEAPALVLDPGPDLAEHREAVLAACGGRAAGVLLTHRHPDHADGAAALAARAGCGVRARDPEQCVRGERLSDGEVLTTGATTLRVVATPGHTSDSCSLLVEGPDGARWLLSGDTVLGRGTSVIASPDGHLGDYLRSLERLAALVAEHRVREILPGHGPRVADPAERLAGYQRHRFERLAQVRAALAAGDRTAEQVVARVYADVDRAVWPAALQSVRAQLLYLAESIAEPATIDVDDFEGEGFQPR